MSTIASLAVQLSVNAARFTAGMVRAGKTLGAFKGAASAAFGGLSMAAGKLTGILGALSIPVSLAGFRAMIGATMQQIDATAKLGDRLGLTTEQLIGLQHASAISGVSSENLTMGLEILSRNLGMLAQEAGSATNAVSDTAAAIDGTAFGAGTLTKRFRALGLDTKRLTQGDLAGALEHIAERFNTLSSAGDKNALAFQTMGRRGQVLFKLLENGKGGLKALIDEAKKLGGTFTREEAARVEAANDAMTRMNLTIQGVKNNIAIGLAPVIEAMANQFTESGMNVKAFGSFAFDATKYAAVSVAFMVDAWNNLADVIELAKIGISKFVAEALQGVGKLFEALSHLPKKFQMGFDFDYWGKVFRAGGEIGAKEAADMWDAWIRPKPSAVQKVLDFFDGLQAKMAAGGAAVAKKADLGALKHLFDLFERGDKLTKEMRNPVEQFADRMGELDELANVGAISWETYSRAVWKASEALRGAEKASEFKMAGAAEFGSQEAFATINKSLNVSGERSGLEGVRDGVKALNEKMAAMRKDMDDVARAARKGMLLKAK